MAKYVTTHKIIGATLIPAGAVVDLTPEQAAHPLYRTRVRKADASVSLEAATPAAANEAGEVKRRGRPPKGEDTTE